MAQTFYRSIKAVTPTREDFLSYEELGIRVSGGEAIQRLRTGVSFFDAFDQACRIARKRRDPFIATISLPDVAAGFIIEQTGENPSHHTIWAPPPATQAYTLLSIVSSVLPVH